jgi:hypothetical protein
MAREKKITVKAYLNKDLKAVDMGGDGKQYYPLYFRVTYMRKVTKFPISNIHISSEREDSLLELETVSNYAEIITRIVNFEIGRNQNFVVKGLGKKVKTYMSRLAGGTAAILKGYLKSKGLKKGGIGNGHYTERVGLGMVSYEAKTSVASAELAYIMFALDQFTPILSIFDLLFSGSVEEELKIVKTRLREAGAPGGTLGKFTLMKYKNEAVERTDLEEILKSVCFFLIANDFQQLTDLEINTIEYNGFKGLLIE